MKAHGSIRRRLFFQLAGVAAALSPAFFLVVRAVAERAVEGTLGLPNAALSMFGTISEHRVFYRIVAAQKTLTGYSDLPLPRITPRPGEPVFATFQDRGEELRAVSVSRPIGPASDATNVVVTVAQTRLGLEVGFSCSPPYLAFGPHDPRHQRDFAVSRANAGSHHGHVSC